MAGEDHDNAAARRPLVARLDMYWRLEALNIVLLPVSALIGVMSLGGDISVSLLVSLLANSVLLSVGACYWRIVHLQVCGQAEPFRRYLPLLAAAEPYAATIVVAALVVFLADVASSGAWGVTLWVTAGATLLALLEYVNYYRWQLQYFDHAPDFRALIRRRRLKRAHMARAIQRWRSGSSL